MLSISQNPKAFRIMVAQENLDILPLYEMIANIPDTVIAIQNGGLSALRMLDKLNYAIDAAVIDLAMSDRDGISVTKDIRREEDIRQKQNPIKIFWLSTPDGISRSTILQAKTDYKVTEIFLKPCNPADIVLRVKGYLNG